MKRNILFGLAAALCLTGMASAKAASAPTVWLDGEQMTFEVAPVIENDRTMVPYRAIFEKLGYQVGWDADTRSVTAAKGNTTMKLTIGSKTVTVNGGTVTSDTAPVIRQDRTLVPLRLVSEYSGCDVLWDKDTRTVAMYHKQAKNAMSEKLGCVTTDGDSLLVEHSDCVTQEHGTQGYSLVNLSPIAFIPDIVIQAVDRETKTGYGPAVNRAIYGNIRELENYRAMNMVTGEILAESPSYMLPYNVWPTLQRDPVQGTLYSSARIYGKDLLFQIDPVTLQLCQTFENPLMAATWVVYDNQLLTSYYSENKAQTELYQIDLQTGDTSCIVSCEGNAHSGVLYGNEFYLSLYGEKNEILVYNIDNGSTYTIPLQDDIVSFDVTQNSIFYLTKSNVPSGEYPYALYRISKNGTLRTLLQDGIEWEQLDEFQMPIKVVGNTIYYYIRDYAEERRLYAAYKKDNNDYQKHPYGTASVASLCALPTCGGTPYVVDRSYWWRGPDMS